jgi:Pretoxin HINT domain
MVHAILLCCVLANVGENPADSTSDRIAYDAAAAKAGNNTTAHVQLSLWCESHGMTSERIKHLTLAVSLDPANLLARGLLGQIAVDGKWATPDQVEQQNRSDAKSQAIFREYLDRRIRTPQKNVNAQLRLAAWCLENSLKDEARAHYFAVTRLDPSRDIAWIRLGFKKVHDRWMKPDQLAAQKLEADRQKRADKEWKPRLEKLRDAVESTIETRRLKAEKELYQVTDPRAVPMIWKVFASGGEKAQLVAVELFSQIEGPGASFCLLVLAIDKPSSEVRSRAARAITFRDPRDTIGWMINRLHKPYKYELTRGTGSSSTSSLLLDGERFDLRRLYRSPELNVNLAYSKVHFNMQRMPGVTEQIVLTNRLMASQWGLMVAEGLEETGRANQLVERTIDDDIRSIEETNAQINETNSRLLAILETLTAQKMPADPQLWQKWWTDQLGYVYDDRYAETKPSYTSGVELPDLAVNLPVVTLSPSCFAAATVVQTLIGPRKIESIAVGDRVLSQHTTTGALSYQPVLVTHKTGPAATFRIAMGAETIVATGIHRFWKAGKGWTMARDLKAGDRLRTVGGLATVDSIERDATQMVYNLTVAENRDFMVGTAGLLVHDYTFVLAVSEPFDRPAKPAANVPR